MGFGVVSGDLGGQKAFAQIARGFEEGLADGGGLAQGTPSRAIASGLVSAPLFPMRPYKQESTILGGTKIRLKSGPEIPSNHVLSEVQGVPRQC